MPVETALTLICRCPILLSSIYEGRIMAEADELFSAAQAAKYLGLHRTRLYQLRKAGLGRQVAGFWVFTKAELDAYKASPDRKVGRPKASAGTEAPAPPA